MEQNLKHIVTLTIPKQQYCNVKQRKLW